MPASPITKTLDVLPKNWRELEKIIIPDNNTAHFYKIVFTEASIYSIEPYVWLLCCYIEDDVTDEERWYHVEEMDEKNKPILDIIKAVFGISFHDKIGV